MINQIANYGDLELNEPLSKHTTYRIGGNAAYFVYPRNEIGLMRIVEICKEQNTDYKVFGKGSNILASDDDYNGVIICLDRYFTDVNFESDGTCTAQAGVSLILLAIEAMKHSFTGLEFASGIPATLGGALYMNAGAYKSDMASIVKRVYVLKDNECIWIDVEDLNYSYRTSIFQTNHDWIILGAELKLTKGNQKDIKELMDARRVRRLQAQPLDKPCAGSVFRNPEIAPAWKLIEDSGLRGMQIGGALVSNKHANFVVNDNQASAKDVDQLIKLIQKTVDYKYHIKLKAEVEKFNWKKEE